MSKLDNIILYGFGYGILINSILFLVGIEVRNLFNKQITVKFTLLTELVIAIVGAIIVAYTVFER